MEKNRALLLAALETEIQAISIYEMECKIFSLTSFSARRKKIYALLSSILEEEKGHAFHLVKHLPNLKPSWIKNFFLIYSGALLGLLLSCVPGPLYFYLHAWAEEQASSIYAETKAKLPQITDELIRDLDESILQEAQHALRFRNLMFELRGQYRKPIS